MGEVRVEGVERLPPEPEPEAEEREAAARVLLRRAAGAAFAAVLAALFAGVEATVLAVTVTGAEAAAALDLALAEVLVARERGVAMTVMG
jgi:anti-sigma factor RsiW